MLAPYRIEATLSLSFWTIIYASSESEAVANIERRLSPQAKAELLALLQREGVIASNMSVSSEESRIALHQDLQTYHLTKKIASEQDSTLRLHTALRSMQIH